MHATSTVNVSDNCWNYYPDQHGWTTAADKRNDQAITLAATLAVKIYGGAVQVDPQHFCNCCTSSRASGVCVQNMSCAVTHQLCLIPHCCFDSCRRADAIWTLPTHNAPGIAGQVQDMLDSGALVQGISWARGSIYKGICT